MRGYRVKSLLTEAPYAAYGEKVLSHVELPLRKAGIRGLTDEKQGRLLLFADNIASTGGIICTGGTICIGGIICTTGLTGTTGTMLMDNIFMVPTLGDQMFHHRHHDHLFHTVVMTANGVPCRWASRCRRHRTKHAFVWASVRGGIDGGREAKSSTGFLAPHAFLNLRHTTWVCSWSGGQWCPHQTLRDAPRVGHGETKGGGDAPMPAANLSGIHTASQRRIVL
jgi:hypothetical protein